MALQVPIENPLTETQENVLAQFTALKNLLTLPVKKPKNVPVNKQISSFDYLIKMIENTIGSAFIDIFLKEFIDKIFDINSKTLETFILKSIAKAMDSNGIYVDNNGQLTNTPSPSGYKPVLSNFQWLNINVMPSLHVAMKVSKGLIAKQVITMIFGPKEKMASDAQTQAYFLNQAVCSGDVFSVSNDIYQNQGDVSYNKVELRKQLEAGQVTFIISCQEVKIKLPENLDQFVNDLQTNNQNTNNTTQNPSAIFEQVGNHVGSEMQRINTEENSNYTRKSFLRILVEKIINLLSTAIQPHIGFIFNTINASNPSLNIDQNSLLSNTCEIVNNCGNSDDEEAKRKAAFTKSFVNLLFGFLISILLRRLIAELKKFVKKVMAKKAQDRAIRKAKKRLAQVNKDVSTVSTTIDNATELKTAYEGLNDIFNYTV